MTSKQNAIDNAIRRVRRPVNYLLIHAIPDGYSTDPELPEDTAAGLEGLVDAITAAILQEVDAKLEALTDAILQEVAERVVATQDGHQVGGYEPMTPRDLAEVIAMFDPELDTIKQMARVDDDLARRIWPDRQDQDQDDV